MNRYATIALIVAAASLATGCEELTMGPANQQPVYGQPQAMGPTGYPQPAPVQPSNLSSGVVTGAADEERAAEQGGVGIALKWSQKYAEAQEQLVAAQRANQELSSATVQLQAAYDQLSAKQADTEQELAEANLMLRDLHQEVKEWKESVLSFRAETMRAHEATLTALQKVLTVLGGEVAPVASR